MASKIVWLRIKVASRQIGAVFRILKGKKLLVFCPGFFFLKCLGFVFGVSMGISLMPKDGLAQKKAWKRCIFLNRTLTSNKHILENCVNALFFPWSLLDVWCKWSAHQFHVQHFFQKYEYMILMFLGWWMSVMKLLKLSSYLWCFPEKTTRPSTDQQRLRWAGKYNQIYT